MNGFVAPSAGRVLVDDVVLDRRRVTLLAVRRQAGNGVEVTVHEVDLPDGRRTRMCPPSLSGATTIHRA